MKSKIILKIVLVVIMACGSLFSNSLVYATSVDSVIKGADDFVSKGENSNKASIDVGELKDTKNFLYNLLLAFGIIITVITGMIIGIKYMVGSVEERADLKTALIGYVISCFVIFGAFGIWKLAVNILSNI